MYAATGRPTKHNTGGIVRPYLVDEPLLAGDTGRALAVFCLLQGAQAQSLVGAHDAGADCLLNRDLYPRRVPEASAPQREKEKQSSCLT